MTLALVIPGISHAAQGGRPVITTQAAAELQSMSAEISAPSKTLIVARHGLEWWTAWYLHTHIAHENAVTEADWKNFDHVYFLHQKGGMQMGPMPGGPGMGGQRPPDRDFRPDGAPDFARAGFPAQQDANNQAFSPRGFGGPMGEPMIPEDAEITHEGEFFTMALAPAPDGLPMATNGNFSAKL
jgi:hypothetical protein